MEQPFEVSFSIPLWAMIALLITLCVSTTLTTISAYFALKTVGVERHMLELEIQLLELKNEDFKNHKS